MANLSVLLEATVAYNVDGSGNWVSCRQIWLTKTYNLNLLRLDAKLSRQPARCERAVGSAKEGRRARLSAFGAALSALSRLN